MEVLGITDPDGDAFTVTITGITQDEPVRGGGSGNTAPDASGIGDGSARVRAERAGKGNGRVYRIAFTATDARGGTATGNVNVCVPHDRGDAACVDDGQQYDATLP